MADQPNDGEASDEDHDHTNQDSPQNQVRGPGQSSSGQPPAGIAYPIVNENNANSSSRQVGSVSGLSRDRVVNAVPPLEIQGLGVLGLPPVAGSRPLYNWQATKATLKDRFLYLYNNEVQADVHFLVGRGGSRQRVPAHKFVLSVGSAVFDAMFNSILAMQSDEVEVPDVEPAAFLALLRFLYTDEVHIGPETVMTTLYTAKKYAVPALEAQCVEFLKKNLSPDNAFTLLTQARLFDEPQLTSLCLDCIDGNTREAVNADGFADIDYSTLVSVLERDTLGVKESLVFPAMVRWAEAECLRQDLETTKENKRKVLGDSLSLVRFPLMNIEEFAQGPAQSGLLTDREIVDLFLYFTLNPKPRVRFSDKPRGTFTGKEYSVTRYLNTAERWGYSGTSDRIRFSVNRKIYIVGFGLFGAINGPADFQVNIQIVAVDSNTVIGQNDTGFSCDGSEKTFRVLFKHPVEIRPHQNYYASATLNGHDSYYGTNGSRRVIKEIPNEGQIIFNFHFAPGNNNGTSVEDGQIPELIYYTSPAAK